MAAYLPTSGVALRSIFDILGGMSHCLASIAALALVCVGLVDGVEVDGQADLACAHLCDDRADRSVCANTGGERPFTRSHSESKELSAVFGRFPGCPRYSWPCSPATARQSTRRGTILGGSVLREGPRSRSAVADGSGMCCGVWSVLRIPSSRLLGTVAALGCICWIGRASDELSVPGMTDILQKPRSNEAYLNGGFAM